MNDFDLRKYKLTERENDVLKYVLKGYTNKQIAQKLYISQDTAKAHVSSILFKIGVDDRIGILVKLFKKNIQDFINNME